MGLTVVADDGPGAAEIRLEAATLEIQDAAAVRAAAQRDRQGALTCTTA